MCNKYSGVRYAFGRKELKRLKQTTLASYFKFLDDYKIPEGQRGNYNAQDSVIKFANGSEILLLDLAHQPSDPLYTRLGSLELTGAFIDESAEVGEQCITILATRIGRQKNEEYGITPKMLQCFNPDKGHVYRNFYKPFKEGTLPDYRVFITALATDNEFLPASYIEQLKKSNEVTKQRLLYGNFDYDDTPGRLFDYDMMLNMWDNLAINGTKYMSIDVARKGKDQTVIGLWDGLELYDVIIQPKSDLKDLEHTIRRRALKDNIEIRNIIADENGVGGGLIDGLRCQGFINNAKPVQPKNANISNLRNFENLKTQCYFKLAELINGGKIKISIQNDEFKSKLLEELDVIVEIGLDKDGKTSIIRKEDVIAKIGRSPDYSDMVMMRVYFELDVFKKKDDKEIEIIIDDGDPWGILNFDDKKEDNFEIDLTPY